MKDQGAWPWICWGNFQEIPWWRKVLVEEHPGRKLRQKEMSSYSLGVWRRDAHNILVSGRQWALGKRMSRIWGMVRN